MQTIFLPIKQARDVRSLAFVVFALIIYFQSVCADAATVRVVCENNAGDAARINAAISTSSPGDEIVIDGRATINQPIKLLGDRSYRGNSRTGTVLEQANGANLPEILASDSFLDNYPTTGLPISIRQLTVDGNAANNTAKTAGIVIRSWLTTVEDVEVTQMGGDGIRVTSLSANNTALTDSQVNGRISNCFVTDSGGYGVFVDDPGNSCTDWTLSDNWIAESGSDGIHLDNAAGWFVDRNHIYGVPGDAIYANRAFGTSITGNYIEGFGETKSRGNYAGIYVTVQGDVGSVIELNRVFNIGGVGNAASTLISLQIAYVNYGAGVVDVLGNVIVGSSSANSVGLEYDKGSREGTSLTISSTGNMVSKVSKQIIISPGVVSSVGL